MTSNDDLRSPWAKRAIDPAVVADQPLRGGAELGPLQVAERRLLDRLSGAALPPQLARDLTRRLDEMSEMLKPYQVPEPERHDGWRPDLPGRGFVMLPPFVVDEMTEHGLSGRVTFTRFHLGGNAAVHGGVQPLLFDDVLGRVTNQGFAVTARTAYLKVDYRRVTPLDVELRIEAALDRVEGRKRYASGRLLDADGNVLCDASSLYVELLPGQP
jgi:acyl-coenzyme A thioesterase PaaI-like protein